MRLLLAMVTVFLCVHTMAQKKPNISKAKLAYDKGELIEAKTIIDQAIDHEKTKNNPKTWFYRGLIYVALDTTNIDPMAMEISVSSFNKALELDPQQKAISEITITGISNADTKLQEYFEYYFNKAVVNYQAEEYILAADNFEKAAFIIPSDTTAIVNVAYAAEAAEDIPRAKASFKKALDVGVKNKNVYLKLYNYAIQEDNMEEALDIIRKCKEVFPGDIALHKYEIDILIRQDKLDEAQTKIEQAILNEPDNPDLYFSLGVMQEGLEDVESARNSYKTAIEKNPDHFNSNFNLGVIIFNEATRFIKDRNALGFKEQKKFDELSIKINEKLNKALPYWETLYNLKSDDQTILETLGYIYTQLRMSEKANKINDKIEALKGK